MDPGAAWSSVARMPERARQHPAAANPAGHRFKIAHPSQLGLIYRPEARRKWYARDLMFMAIAARAQKNRL